jgi:hypothetical protein
LEAERIAFLGVWALDDVVLIMEQYEPGGRDIDMFG